jgi:hypothetical protein
MAAPAYTEDLTDITLAEDTGSWSALGGGASGLSASPDLSMQGTNCVDKQVTAAEKGMVFDNGAGITLPAGAHIYTWLYVATPGLTDTLANRGATIAIGTTTSAYCKYHVEGNNTYGAAGRVGKCYVVDYTVRTSNTGSSPYRTLVGSPGANPQVFGGLLNTTASVKGANIGIDAIRYGTGAYITAGDAGQPATFAGFSAQNDSVTNRWGILTNVGGGYELKGRFVIGQNNSKTPTQAYFADSDRSIVIPATVHAATDFTQIIVDHASTTCLLTNINITALGTNNRGRFVVNAGNPTVTITGGTWTSMAFITFRSNTTATRLTLRSTNLITLNGATLTNCLIDVNRGASSVLAATLNNMTGCTFNSDGSNHAVELNSIGAGSMTWNNQLSGYVAGSTGSPVTPTSTGNEAIYVNVGSGTLTINVAAGATIPSIRSAGATVNVVAGLSELAFTVSPSITGYEYRIYTVTAAGSLAGATEVQGQESATQDNQSYSYTYSAGVVYAIQILPHANDYEESVTYYNASPNDQNVTINLKPDINN